MKLNWDEIKKLPLIYTLNNKWRGRIVHLYQHPTDPEKVISVGIPYGCDDCNAYIILEDDQIDWTYYVVNNIKVIE